MISKPWRRFLFALATVSLSGIAACELAVDFDRSKIDGGAADGSVGDTSTDAPITGDASEDAVADAPADVVADARQDVVTDASDASSDAPADANDGG